MFNPALLEPEVQEFIRNFKEDISKLAFGGSPFKSIPVQDLMTQIESRRKTEKKLPTWFSTPGIVFPPKLNVAQTSSEITAKYKSDLIHGETLADITGGFGVDSFYFAHHFGKVHHFEINTEVSAIAKHNFKVLGIDNISCFPTDGMEGILQTNYNAIFADPSRRHESKGKVFYLRDCQPNIPDNISAILNRCDIFLLKTSPMLDISVGLSELMNVFEIHVVAVDNEVKELLWLLVPAPPASISSISIKTVNIHKKGVDHFNFVWQQTAEPTYSLPRKYLYEPNAAIFKSGAFNLISEELEVDKLHYNTHLYTKDTLVAFPGRSFFIEKILPYSKRNMRSLDIKNAHITTRNFPESVIAIRKKWKIGDGGDIYLFFITALDDKKYVLQCKKT